MGEGRRRGSAEAPNLGEPATPRPSASVVLLRRGGKHGDRALEVLLLKRAEEAKFMPGVWVFPGGAVDPEDGAGEAGHRACAVRELEEEAGIALPEDEELVLFSRWITPEVVSRRFDAWFFLALAPGAHAAEARRRRDHRGRLVRAPQRRSRPNTPASSSSLSRRSSNSSPCSPTAPPRKPSKPTAAAGRAHPAEGDRHPGPTPRRPTRRPRLSRRRPWERAPARRARGRADTCAGRSRPSRPAAA